MLKGQLYVNDFSDYLNLFKWKFSTKRTTIHWVRLMYLLNRYCIMRTILFYIKEWNIKSYLVSNTLLVNTVWFELYLTSIWITTINKLLQSLMYNTEAGPRTAKLAQLMIIIMKYGIVQILVYVYPLESPKYVFIPTIHYE